MLILLHILLSPFYFLFFYNIAHILTVGFTFSITFVLIFFIRMRQNYHLLRSRECVTCIGYCHYRRQYTQTLLYFFECNRMYGRIFLSVLATFCPINVVLSMLVTLHNIPPQNSIVVVFHIVYEYLFIFGMHLFLTNCTKHIHRPAKVLTRLNATRQAINPHNRVRNRFRLALDLFVVHTKERYGFTYGNFGLISLDTFVKVWV